MHDLLVERDVAVGQAVHRELAGAGVARGHERGGAVRIVEHRMERSGEHAEDADFVRGALELLDERISDTKAHRRAIGKAVEALIDHLDGIDGDVDLEDDEREHEEPEPSLGWTTAFDQTARPKYYGDCDDYEDEHDGRELEAGI